MGLGGGQEEQELEEGTQEVTSYTEVVTPGPERHTAPGSSYTHSWDPQGSEGLRYTEHAHLLHPHTVGPNTCFGVNHSCSHNCISEHSAINNWLLSLYD